MNLATNSFANQGSVNHGVSGIYPTCLIVVVMNIVFLSLLVVAGGDWRNLLPALGLSWIVVQLALSAGVLAYARERRVLALLLLLAVAIFSAVVGALATRPRPSTADVLEWLRIALYFSGIVFAIAVGTRIVGFRFVLIGAAGEAVPWQPYDAIRSLGWSVFCLGVLLILVFTTRPFSKSHPTILQPEWIKISAVYVVVSLLAVGVMWATGVKLPRLVEASNRPRWKRQWTLNDLFSITTCVAVVLGIWLVLKPSPEDHRHAAMMSIEAIAIIGISAICTLNAKQLRAAIWIPFAACPPVLLLTAIFETGQGDGDLQTWLAGIHQDGLDYGICQSGGVATAMFESVAALSVAFFYFLRKQGWRLALGPV